MNKRMDLRGLDYKMVDGFIIVTSNMKVYTQQGLCLGGLPKGSFPQSGPEILDKVQPLKSEEVKPQPQTMGEKVKNSISNLKGKK